MPDGELRDTHRTAHHDALTPPKTKKKHAHRSIHPDARDRDFQRVRATNDERRDRSNDRSPIIDRYHRGYGFDS